MNYEEGNKYGTHTRPTRGFVSHCKALKNERIWEKGVTPIFIINISTFVPTWSLRLHAHYRYVGGTNLAGWDFYQNIKAQVTDRLIERERWYYETYYVNERGEAAFPEPSCFITFPPWPKKAQWLWGLCVISTKGLQNCSTNLKANWGGVKCERTRSTSSD